MRLTESVLNQVARAAPTQPGKQPRKQIPSAPPFDPTTLDVVFNRATLEGREVEFMAEAVRTGQISGDGPFTHKCQTWLEVVLGVQKALLATSCTDALEMAAILLNLQPEAEVIVPSFTFVSTANAFVLHGARPVFCDVRPDTLNLDEKQLPELLTPRTRAVVVVHYGGVGCEMPAIQTLVERDGITLIEDNAHGLLARHRGHFLGTFGALAALSFHETKNFTCGEGGALLINDERYIDRAEVIRQKGTNRARFSRGEVDKYTWRDVGSSYLPSDLLAAFLYAQFLKADQIQAKRRRVWEYYLQHLQDWARTQQVGLPVVPPHNEQAYHLFYMLMPSLEARQALIQQLRSLNILSVFHYQPLHLSDMGRRFGGKPGMCPVAEAVNERIIRLPFYNDLSQCKQDKVVEAVRQFTV